MPTTNLDGMDCRVGNTIRQANTIVRDSVAACLGEKTDLSLVAMGKKQLVPISITLSIIRESYASNPFESVMWWKMTPYIPVTDWMTITDNTVIVTASHPGTHSLKFSTFLLRC